MNLADLQTALGPAEPKYRARQIYDAVYRRRVTTFDSISNLPNFKSSSPGMDRFSKPGSIFRKFSGPRAGKSVTTYAPRSSPKR